MENELILTELDIRNQVRQEMRQTIETLIDKETDQSYVDCDSLEEIREQFRKELQDRILSLVPEEEVRRRFAPISWVAKVRERVGEWLWAFWT